MTCLLGQPCFFSLRPSSPYSLQRSCLVTAGPSLFMSRWTCCQQAVGLHRWPACSFTASGLPRVLSWFSLPDARCPPKLLDRSPSSMGQGRKSTMKGSWGEIRAGIYFPHQLFCSPITVMGKTDSSWGNQFNLSPIKSEQDNEK